jgi:hypothetical protein
LDHIYSLDENFPCGVLEAYWSDHKRTWICI